MGVEDPLEKRPSLGDLCTVGWGGSDNASFMPRWGAFQKTRRYGDGMRTRMSSEDDEQDDQDQYDCRVSSS